MSIRTLITIFLGGLLTLISVAVDAAVPRDGAIAPIEISSSLIQWRVQVPSDGFTLRVTKPDGETYFTASPARVPALAVSDLGAGPLDGTYTYELIVVPPIPHHVKELMKQHRKNNDEAAARKLAREVGIDRAFAESGSFSIINGSFVRPEQESSSSARATATTAETSNGGGSATSGRGLRPALDDQVIPDDLIVQGSICAGFDCVINESFGFDTIRLKENNTRIKFEDTSTGTFPANDWQFTANDSASGGANKLSIEDITGGRIPFTITAGAATNSVFIDSTGRVGFRTSTPVLDLHVNTSNTPAIRLEQNSSGGFTAQTWDVAGNEANFFIRDVTSGSRLPFRIRPGAPTSSIDISASGNVGIGTASPADKLHVTGPVRSVGGASTFGAVTAIADTTAYAQLLTLGSARGDVYFNQAAANWSALLNAGNDTNGLLIGTYLNKPVVFGTNNLERLRIAPDGNIGIGVGTPTNPIQHSSGAVLTAGGVWQNASSRELKQGIAGIDPDEALGTVMALNPVKFSYRAEPHERHIGFIAEDVPALVAASDRKSLSPMDIVAVLTRVVQEQQKTIDELSARLDHLEKSRD